jgi:hypothetical protein
MISGRCKCFERVSKKWHFCGRRLVVVSGGARSGALRIDLICEAISAPLNNINPKRAARFYSWPKAFCHTLNTGKLGAQSLLSRSGFLEQKWFSMR